MTWRIERGDCLLPLTGIMSLGEKSVDHVITDPPFESEAHTLQRRIKRKAGVHDGGEYSTDNVAQVEALDFAPISESQRLDAAVQIAHVTRRWALVFCQIEAAMKWRRALESAGMIYKRTCIWVKPDGMPQLTGDRPGMGYETFVACHAPGKSKWNGGGKNGVFIVNKNDSDRSNHPTQKPDALMESLVTLFTDYGDTILDPFAGSGSTGVAAIRRGRNFIGWEMIDKYHRTATMRLEGTREQMSIAYKKPKKPKQMKLIGGANVEEESKEGPAVEDLEAKGSVPGHLLGERSDEANADREGEKADEREPGGVVPPVVGGQEIDPFDPEAASGEESGEADPEAFDGEAFGAEDSEGEPDRGW